MILSTRLLSGLAPVVYEDGRQTRNIVFVTDVAHANIVDLVPARARSGARRAPARTGASVTGPR
jgi:nucleoside-diphosphate-sugar epimerase